MVLAVDSGSSSVGSGAGVAIVHKWCRVFEPHLCQGRKKNNSLEMMNYSGVVAIQKPCYTENGITGKWE